ncbi:hypothetical protein B0H14DRAFT_3463568, partial [Mycena olivaceomarginata]
MAPHTLGEVVSHWLGSERRADFKHVTSPCTLALICTSTSRFRSSRSLSASFFSPPPAEESADGTADASERPAATFPAAEESTGDAAEGPAAFALPAAEEPAAAPTPEDSISDAAEGPPATEDSISDASKGPLTTEDSIGDASKGPLTTENPVSDASKRPLTTEDSIGDASKGPLTTESSVSDASKRPLTTENSISDASEGPAAAALGPVLLVLGSRSGRGLLLRLRLGWGRRLGPVGRRRRLPLLLPPAAIAPPRGLRRF